MTDADKLTIIGGIAGIMMDLDGHPAWREVQIIALAPDTPSHFVEEVRRCLESSNVSQGQWHESLVSELEELSLGLE